MCHQCREVCLPFLAVVLLFCLVLAQKNNRVLVPVPAFSVRRAPSAATSFNATPVDKSEKARVVQGRY